MRHLAAVAFLFAAPVMGAGAAFADEISAGEAWPDRARAQIEFTPLTLEGEGWTLARKLNPGVLRDSQTGSVPLFLNPRTEYAIAAVCDEQCGDLSLFLYDSADTLVTADCRDAGLPVVKVTPAERERYELAVRMIDCADEACAYSVAVFSRPASTPAALQPGGMQSRRPNPRAEGGTAFAGFPD